MRPRKLQRHLPSCVYLRHGAYWYVKRGKWTRLGADLDSSLAEYARLQDQKLGGMQALIEEAMPVILAGKAATTIKQYKQVALKLQDILAEFSPHQVTPRDVAQIRRGLTETPAIANRALTVLKMVFNYALDEQLVATNPCVGIKRLHLEARTRRISPGEFRAIQSKAPALLSVVMDLCYATGQRIGDVLKIARADISDAGIFIEQQKTKKRLMLGWTPDLQDAVARARELHGNVSHLYLLGSRPPNYHQLHKQWTKACVAAGVEDANLHDLRAMSGTDASAQGIDAQQLLGHTDAATTRLYLRDKIVPVVTGPTMKRAKG